MLRPVSFLSKLFFLGILGLFGPTCSLFAQAFDASYATVEFEKPQSQAALNYLGLAQDKNILTLNEINAPVLVVEIFSVSCPHCQHAAKNFESLYELIQKRWLSEKIKILGIAMNSLNFEVEVFKQKNGIQFPLVADPKNCAFRIVGSKFAYPHVLVLRRDDSGKFITVYSKSKETREGKDMLETILSVTGLNNT